MSCEVCREPDASERVVTKFDPYLDSGDGTKGGGSLSSVGGNGHMGALGVGAAIAGPTPIMLPELTTVWKGPDSSSHRLNGDRDAEWKSWFSDVMRQQEASIRGLVQEQHERTRQRFEQKLALLIAQLQMHQSTSQHEDSLWSSTCCQSSAPTPPARLPVVPESPRVIRQAIGINSTEVPVPAPPDTIAIARDPISPKVIARVSEPVSPKDIRGKAKAEEKAIVGVDIEVTDTVSPTKQRSPEDIDGTNTRETGPSMTSAKSGLGNVTNLMRGPSKEPPGVMARFNPTGTSNLKFLDEKKSAAEDEVNIWTTALDVGISVVIVINTWCLFVQAQYKGWLSAPTLGMPRDEVTQWPNANTWFDVLDHMFNVTFLLELGVRLYMFGCSYFKEVSNVFDFIIVMATSIDAYFIQPLELGSGENLSVARLVRIMRLMRIVRVVRILRFAKNLSQLRVLTKTLESSSSALFWSMMLLAVIIIGGGIFLAQICNDFIDDEQVDWDIRLWVFRYYGTAATATYTLFEATFSGSWPNYARPMVEDMHAAFSIFWVLYNVIISFAVLRVIGAIFLNETIRAANNDAEMMVMNKLKEKEIFTEKLRAFFKAADTSGDGLMDADEFQAMLDDPHVITWLQVVELEIYEVMALFRLLDDNGDGAVSFEEFLGGAMRLKGNARAIDSIAIMHEQTKLRNMVTVSKDMTAKLVAEVNALTDSLTNHRS
eukprot:gnl/TRDRNA2_/TRDRNA2_164269_c0_seq3.p1 gnl/TRDRNA2_/TRDRNA2_164269_c0~~gnl/TRDRNA2_/TRDRNA2_164269_c0_seq3.p1  ORF type:complete len:714 (+),score=113.62 gnl/TRDRNA2_/TRDRNA2_164269_c0_seq3:70-2211(+)